MNQQVVYIGCDHRGFALKQKLAQNISQFGFLVQDLGSSEYDPSDDYPDIAAKVAKAVAANSEALGILICGSSVGVTVAANKIKSIRAAGAFNESQVTHARNSDNINVLSLAADELSDDDALNLVKIFLNTEFSGEDRHRRRLEKIAALEEEFGTNE